MSSSNLVKPTLCGVNSVKPELVNPLECSGHWVFSLSMVCHMKGLMRGVHDQNLDQMKWSRKSSRETLGCFCFNGLTYWEQLYIICVDGVSAPKDFSEDKHISVFVLPCSSRCPTALFALCGDAHKDSFSSLSVQHGFQTDDWSYIKLL